ncbi:MAG: 4Fe-4S binding protein [Methanobacterium sp.]|uniref:4Fe-4S binding protein n=1 Tax=Methanobacterium sp. TaxID=2164 RepID=UPI003D65C14D|nr:4Fe-4S binding protein [Methanobacterium sp.]
MKFNIEKCGCCGACISVCPNNSLELTESIIFVNEDNCNDCGRCTIICPLGALLLEVEGNSQKIL